MHEGVVQFEQWRPKKQSMDNDRKASLTQRDTVSQTTSRRHAAKKIVKLVFSPTNSHPLQLAFSVALSPYLRTFDAFRRPFKAHGQYYSVARSQLPQGAPPPPGVLRLVTDLKGFRQSHQGSRDTNMALYLCSCSLQPQLPPRVRTWNIVGFTAKCPRCASTASVKCKSVLWHDFRQRECVSAIVTNAYRQVCAVQE